MSYACEIIQLLSVVFYVVRAVHMNHIRNGNGWKEGYAVMETQVRRRIYMLNPPAPPAEGAVFAARGWAVYTVKWSMLGRQPCVRPIPINREFQQFQSW
jgi:hypothetical protein